MDLKTWCAAKRKERCEELIAFFGGVAKVAEFLDMPFTTVYAWQQRGGVSSAGARHIEKMTQGRFSAGYLNPTAREWFLETQKGGANAAN